MNILLTYVSFVLTIYKCQNTEVMPAFSNRKVFNRYSIVRQTRADPTPLLQTSQQTFSQWGQRLAFISWCSQQVGELVIEKLLISVAINQQLWNLDFLCGIRVIMSLHRSRVSDNDNYRLTLSNPVYHNKFALYQQYAV